MLSHIHDGNGGEKLIHNPIRLRLAQAGCGETDNPGTTRAAGTAGMLWHHSGQDYLSVGSTETFQPSTNLWMVKGEGIQGISDFFLNTTSSSPKQSRTFFFHSKRRIKCSYMSTTFEINEQHMCWSIIHCDSSSSKIAEAKPDEVFCSQTFKDSEAENKTGSENKGQKN